MKILIFGGDDGFVSVLQGEGIFPAFGITDANKVTGSVEIQSANLVSAGEDILIYIPGKKDSWLKKAVFWLAKTVLV